MPWQEFPREEIFCVPTACHGARLISSGCASVGIVSLERIRLWDCLKWLQWELLAVGVVSWQEQSWG